MKTRDTLTHAVEDYLKSIYEITLSGKSASTKEISKRMGVRPASVTGMLQRLAALEPALITYRKHRGVELTPSGERAALEVIRHHRLLETYLVENLGYSWDEVHAEADRLEHVISEDFEARIAHALGHPARDPHGELIPNADLTMPDDETMPLSSLRPVQQAVIQRVNADDAALLRHLDSLGLIPGVEITVLEYSPYDHNLHIRAGRQGEPIVLGFPVTSRIFVEKI